jgi:hypothetical protein
VKTVYIIFKFLDNIEEISNTVSKRKNQENIINFLNGIENINPKGKIQSSDEKSKLKANSKDSLPEYFYNDSYLEIEKIIFNKNLNCNINNEKSNINLKKLKVENFEEKIKNSLKVENLKPKSNKKKININNEKEFKNSRINKIKNFIQGITKITNLPNANSIITKNDINRSFNHKEKTFCEFELDSDYDVFLGKPLTDREERDRLNTILDTSGKFIKKNKEENFSHMNNIETSFKYEEGESKDFNEKKGINNFYNAKYNKMEHLYSDRKILK